MTYTLRACGSIAEIGQDNWDRCANPFLDDPACGIPFDPFVSYAFLSALEESESVCPETGWAPYHVVLEEEREGVIGVVPMYLKSHSQGEYVFDHHWADAFERAGGQYYPKLQICVPFTPATGRRLLTGNITRTDTAETENLLLGGVMKMAENLETSSVHITFANKAQWERMGALGFLQRTHKQFHWQNNGYSDFNEFISELSSKKRKNIKRERKEARDNDIEIEWITGSGIKEHHWDAFYQFYIDTGGRKWGRPYLSRMFFSLIGQSMPDRVLLIMCKRGGHYIAGAINFIGSECLFGRNWGCIEDHRFLHFEVCYYQAIDYAIAHGLSRVEAGAQGPHKLARGYLPAHTYSAHWIVNQSFRDAVDHFLRQERQYVDEEIETIAEHSPFRRVER
ncbi:MAG: GNAT family N-acetyltransferase [Pseudomonadales bacterium]